MSILIAAALSASLLLQQAAPVAQATQDTTDIEGLVVTAKPQPAKEAIAGFVASVSAETGNGKLARWDRKICPGVIGLKPGHAQLLIDRIAATAMTVGLAVGEPGCRANMIIVGSSDSGPLVEGIVKENPDAFGKYDSSINRGRRHLDAFVASDAPVRWWHVTARVTADGQRYRRGEQVRVREVGRLRSNVREDFNHVVIVMDAKRIGSMKMTALADYIAMVGLAQIEPEAKTASVSTILNLFADRDAGLTPPEALTEWDVAYLKGLYAAPRDAPRGIVQEREMVRTMTDDLGGAPKAGDKKD